MRLPLALVLAALLALPSVASAQTGVLPSGNYGGGAVPAPPANPYGSQGFTVGIRATDAAPSFSAVLGGRCAHGRVRTTLRLRPDGTFDQRGRTVWREYGTRFVTTWRLKGGVGATGAGGSLNATTRVAGLRCSAGGSWRARRLASGSTGSPGRNVSSLYGTTSRRFGGARHGVVLRMGDDGATLVRALFGSEIRCTRRFGAPVGLDAPRRRLRVRVDGTVRDVERYAYRVGRDLLVRGVDTFRAQIGSTGARGSARTRLRVTFRRSGRTYARCDSGTVRFTAGPA